jgi:hypothetical protein
MWQDDGNQAAHAAPPPIRYPEALELARIMSVDLLPIAPAWAVSIDGLIGEGIDASDPPSS